jgi:3-isopropylmalate dehydrogenase
VAGSTSAATATQGRRWLDCVVDRGVERRPEPLLGVLPGEGVGPEITDAALEVLRRLGEAGGAGVAVEVGGPIGRDAERISGTALPDEVVDFCRGILDRSGAILSGPGGGRYVYDLRRKLDLFLKISPIQIWNGLPEASPLRPERLDGVDLLLVRENLGGVYQGRPEAVRDGDGNGLVRHAFHYSEADVRRFLDAAARLAHRRRGELTVVTKEAGVPAVSRLWRECATEAASEHGVRCSMVDTDLAAYRLVDQPQLFDVIAAPNLYGDVLSDLAAVLLGSRGLSFSGNFTTRGDAVYQTNHGAAYDIAGTDRANPIGQILSTVMLLRESLGLEREARAVEEGIRRVWREGRRTDDLARPGERAVGTREMTALVAEAAAGHLGSERSAA